jgi:predicted RNA methylase
VANYGRLTRLKHPAARHFFQQLAKGKCIVIPGVSDYVPYDDTLYDILEADEIRTNSYAAAIRRQVNGKVVADIGTGRDALLAILSAQAGAAKVYAIEKNEYAARAAKKIVASHGLEHVVSVIEGDARTVLLPQRVDILVFELFGHVATSEGAAVILNHVTSTFLKPGGKTIPRAVETMCSPVSRLPCQKDPKVESAAAHYSVAATAIHGREINPRQLVYNCPADCRIAEPGVFEALRFGFRTHNQNIAKLRFQVRERTSWSGFGLWLNLTLDDDITFNTFTGTHWGMTWLEINKPPVSLYPGDVIECTLFSQLSKNGLNPNYFIAGKLLRGKRIIMSFETAYPFLTRTAL